MAQKLETDQLKSLDEILSRVHEIAVLPQVAHRLIEVTNADDSSPEDVERAVETDPGFSAKLIAAANSSQWSLVQKTATIRDACLLLGFRQVRTLAEQAGVFDLFVGKNDKESLRRRDWWRISVETAKVAKWIAQQKGAYPDLAYTAGLFHLLGKTMIDQSDPDNYNKVMYVVDRGAPERLAEKTVFAVDHIEAGQEMARRWNFPELLIDAMDYLDVPRVEGQSVQAASCVHLAHAIVKASRLEFSLEEATNFAKPWAFEALQVDPLTFENWVIQSIPAQAHAA